MLIALFAVALQSTPLPAGYSTRITVSAHGGQCHASFIKTDGSAGYSAELPMQGIAEEFEGLTSQNLSADDDAELTPLQEYGKRNARAIEGACARSDSTGGGTVIAVN